MPNMDYYYCTAHAVEARHLYAAWVLNGGEWHSAQMMLGGASEWDAARVDGLRVLVRLNPPCQEGSDYCLQIPKGVA